MTSFHFAAFAIASRAGNHMYACESPHNTIVRRPCVSPNRHAGILWSPTMHGLVAGNLVDGSSDAADASGGVTSAGSFMIDGATATSAATCLAVLGGVLAAAACAASVATTRQLSAMSDTRLGRCRTV